LVDEKYVAEAACPPKGSGIVIDYKWTDNRNIIFLSTDIRNVPEI
jgi:hypothetical protein